MSDIKAPVSHLAQFVQGDIKGGAHAHAFRTATIRTAIEQLFKGNYSPITEASALTEGKAKKARAYHAGFATFGVLGEDTVKVDYAGKLDSAANKEIRAVIEQKTHAATITFFVAYDKVMAEKAEPKAKTAPAAPAPAADPAPAVDATTVASADDLRHAMAVEQDEAVCKVVALVSTGLLTGAQWDLIATAMNDRAALEETARLAAVAQQAAWDAEFDAQAELPAVAA